MANRSRAVSWRLVGRCCAIALVAFVAVSSFANTRTLRIETIASVPFGFEDARGTPTGIMLEIGDMIAKEAGMPSTNRIVPYARTVISLEAGTCDFVLRFSNEKLSQVAIPVASVVTFPIVIVGGKGSYFNALTELRGKTVAVPRGGSFDDAFDADPAIRKQETRDYVDSMQLIRAGRIDAGIGSNVGLFYSAKSIGMSPKDLGHPLVLGHKNFILHFSKRNADKPTVQAVQGAVERLQKSGAIKAVLRKYLGDFAWD